MPKLLRILSMLEVAQTPDDLATTIRTTTEEVSRMVMPQSHLIAEQEQTVKDSL